MIDNHLGKAREAVYKSFSKWGPLSPLKGEEGGFSYFPRSFGGSWTLGSFQKGPNLRKVDGLFGTMTPRV